MIGKVRIACVVNFNIEILVILEQVNHSQQLNDEPWIISMADGKIVAAHCDCIALLWAITAGVERLINCYPKECILGNATSRP